MAKPNRLSSLVLRVQKAGLPASLQQFALTTLFNHQVKFAGTAGIWIQELSPTKSVVHLANRRKVQNHIGGIHACGMALLAESATGMVFGMNVPDTHIPLIKTMKIEYKRRVQGNLKAVASLTPEQLDMIQSADRGEVNVAVQISDEAKQESSSSSSPSLSPPIECELIWAWVPKPNKTKSPSSKL